MGHQVQLPIAEDSHLVQVMSLSRNELLELTLCFFPQCFWSSWSRDLLFERLETLL